MHIYIITYTFKKATCMTVLDAASSEHAKKIITQKYKGAVITDIIG